MGFEGGDKATRKVGEAVALQKRLQVELCEISEHGVRVSPGSALEPSRNAESTERDVLSREERRGDGDRQPRLLVSISRGGLAPLLRQPTHLRRVPLLCRRLLRIHTERTRGRETGNALRPSQAAERLGSMGRRRRRRRLLLLLPLGREPQRPRT